MTKWLPFILVIAWMGLIFSFSHQDAHQSSQMSSTLNAQLIVLIETVLPVLASNIDETQLESTVRSVAHVGLYLVLGLYMTAALNPYIKPVLKLAGYSITFGIVYAITDEVHQYFIPGRAMTWGDIALDSLGVILGTGIMILMLRKAIIETNI